MSVGLLLDYWHARLLVSALGRGPGAADEGLGQGHRLRIRGARPDTVPDLVHRNSLSECYQVRDLMGRGECAHQLCARVWYPQKLSSGCFIIIMGKDVLPQPEEDRTVPGDAVYNAGDTIRRE